MVNFEQLEEEKKKQKEMDDKKAKKGLNKTVMKTKLKDKNMIEIK